VSKAANYTISYWHGISYLIRICRNEELVVDDEASTGQWIHSVDCGFHASQVIPLYLTTVTIATHHCSQTIEYNAISRPELQDFALE
jgi:hypothetical protein